MRSSNLLTIQEKVNKNKDAVIAALNRKKIPFATEQFICDSEDGEKGHGFAIVTEEVSSIIVPDYVSRGVGFLIYNSRMAEHLESEGLSQEEIDEHGKIWGIVENRSKFIKILGC